MTITYPNVIGDIGVYMDVMQAICGDTAGKSMIDIGCCTAPNTPKLGFKHRTYIDIIDRKLDIEPEQPFFAQADILDLPIDKGIWHDVAIASDVIEHMTIENGYKLIRIMEAISQMQILFTPLTDLFGMAEQNNPDPEAHRSLWHYNSFDGYNAIVFPDYHKAWGGGAFFVFKTPSLKYDFDRIVNILNQKPWAKV